MPVLVARLMPYYLVIPCHPLLGECPLDLSLAFLGDEGVIELADKICVLSGIRHEDRRTVSSSGLTTPSDLSSRVGTGESEPILLWNHFPTSASA